jgi:hypothetical protein
VIVVITIVRLARVVVIVMLAFITVSFVIGVATPNTGLPEKFILLILIGGCIYAAAKVSALTERAVQHLARR